MPSASDFDALMIQEVGKRANKSSTRRGLNPQLGKITLTIPCKPTGTCHVDVGITVTRAGRFHDGGVHSPDLIRLPRSSLSVALGPESGGEVL